MLICDINIFNRYGKQRLDEMLKSLNIDWRILVAILVIDAMPNITQSYLSRFLQTDKANVTKLLQHMEEKEWISRVEDTEDHRNKRCKLLEKGEELVPRLQKIMAAWESRCFADISDKELAIYLRINQKITQNMTREWYEDWEKML